MKQQTTALLLSALLLSTFATEHHLKSRQAPKSKNYRHLISTRDESQNQCKWECHGGPSDNNTSPAVTNGTLTLLIKGNGSLIAIVNAEAKLAIVIDVSASLVAIFDGSSGTVVIFNFKSGTGFFISGGKFRHAWVASNSNFKEYFASLSLTVIYETYQKSGTSFNSTSISAEISDIIVRILVNISEEYAIKFKDSTGKNLAVLTVLVDISNRISNVYLSGIFSLLVSGTTVTTTDFSSKVGITGFISKLEGIVIIAGRINGGVKVLIDKSVRFNLQVILTARHGIDVFVYVITQVTIHFKISTILGGDSFSVVFLLIGKFEADGSEGSQDFLLLFSALLEVARSQGKNRDINEAFIRYLIQVSTTLKVRGSYYREQLQNVFSSLYQLFISDGSLSALAKYCEDGKNNKLQINGTPISIIIDLLFKLSEAPPLDIIVTVLLKLVVIRAEVAILQFLLIILKYLNSPADRYILVLIINDPSVKEIANSNSDNLLGELLKSVSGSTIIRLLKGDISIVYKIRVIGAIFTRVNTAVKKASGGSLSLEVTFKSRQGFIFVKEIFTMFSRAHGGGTITGGWSIGGDGEGNGVGGGNSTGEGESGGEIHGGGGTQTGGGIQTGGGFHAGGGTLGGAGIGGGVFNGGGAVNAGRSPNDESSGTDQSNNSEQINGLEFGGGNASSSGNSNGNGLGNSNGNGVGQGNGNGNGIGNGIGNGNEGEGGHQNDRTHGKNKAQKRHFNLHTKHHKAM